MNFSKVEMFSKKALSLENENEKIKRILKFLRNSHKDDKCCDILYVGVNFDISKNIFLEMLQKELSSNELELKNIEEEIKKYLL